MPGLIPLRANDRKRPKIPNTGPTSSPPPPTQSPPPSAHTAQTRFRQSPDPSPQSAAPLLLSLRERKRVVEQVRVPYREAVSLHSSGTNNDPNPNGVAPCFARAPTSPTKVEPRWGSMGISLQFPGCPPRP